METRRKLWLSAACAAALSLFAWAPAAAQEQGSLFHMSWGESGVAGLHVTERCSVGGSWWYALSNQTSKPLMFKYRFTGESHDHAAMLRPHAQLTLRRSAPKFACNTDGPLDISPP